VILLVIIYLYEKKNEYDGEPNSILEAVANFFLWLKFFYFMRLNEFTTHFVRMFVNVIKFSKIFALIYFFMLMAFSTTNLILCIEKNSALLSLFQTYLTGLGEFDLDFKK